MSRICSLDVNFIYALNTIKNEIFQKVCNNFLEDIKKIKLKIIIFESVKACYDYTMNANLSILRDILRDLKEQISNIGLLKIDILNKEMKSMFAKYIQKYRNNKNKQEWINRFESDLLNLKRDIINKNKKEKEENIIMIFLTEANERIIYYRDVANSTYDSLLRKSDYIPYTPKEITIREANKIIDDLEDCTHISSCWEYGITEDKWIFFISLDYTHIVSDKQRKKIIDKFQIIFPYEPKYAIDSIKKFNENIEESPIPYINNKIKASNIIPGNYNELNELAKKTLSISIFESEIASRVTK